MEKEWSPNPIVLKIIEETAKKRNGKPITVGSVSKTFDNILNDVKTGTEFGMTFHSGILKKIEELLTAFYEHFDSDLD